MPKSGLKLVEKRSRALFPVLVWLVIGSGMTCAQTVGLAERTVSDADKLKTEWKSDALKLAGRKYAKAQGLFHRAGEFRREAETLEKLGEVSTLLSDYQRRHPSLQPGAFGRREYQRRAQGSRATHEDRGRILGEGNVQKGF